MITNPLPPLATEEYDRLRADIAAHGVRQPIEVDTNGVTLDGWHRQAIADELGIACPVVVVQAFDTDDETLAYQLRVNLNRRNMAPEQRDEVHDQQVALARRLNEQEWTQKRIADVVGVAQQTVTNWLDVSITNSGNPYFDGRIRVPRSEHPKIAERIDDGETHAQVAADYGITRPRVSQIVAQYWARSTEPESVVTPGFPDGPFRTIVIDPPWPMTKIEREVRPNQGKSLDYATMTLEQITELPIDRLADERGAHVYLWVTHRFLPAGLDLFKAWDVRYQCVLTWAKNVGPTPFSWMYDSELVLFGRSGTDLPLGKQGERLVFNAPAVGHSIKPEVFYDKVRLVSPEPRIDCFARRAIDGFRAWPELTEVTS